MTFICFAFLHLRCNHHCGGLQAIQLRGVCPDCLVYGRLLTDVAEAQQQSPIFITLFYFNYLLQGVTWETRTSQEDLKITGCDDGRAQLMDVC